MGRMTNPAATGETLLPRPLKKLGIRNEELGVGGGGAAWLWFLACHREGR